MPAPTIGSVLNALPFIKDFFGVVLTTLANEIKAAVPDSTSAVDAAVAKAMATAEEKFAAAVDPNLLATAGAELIDLAKTHSSEAPPNPAGLI